MAWKRYSVLPGFGLTGGFTVTYASLIVLIPLAALLIRNAGIPWETFWKSVSAGSAVSAYKLSLGASLAGALLNCVFGLIVAWVLVRYRFPGKRLFDALIDLPFALPTAVAGLTLTTLYAPNGWFGQWLEPMGIKVAFTRLGIVIALTFVGLPFVVRTVQPVLEDLEGEVEEAAACLGANRWQTFVKIIFPTVFPALLTGFAMAFARGVGEYGSVVFIAGNFPGKTVIIPQLIMEKLEQYDYAGATAIAGVMLVMSFAMLLLINLIQWWNSKRYAAR